MREVSGAGGGYDALKYTNGCESLLLSFERSLISKLDAAG